MREAVIGLGSNLGDRLAHLQKGITDLSRTCTRVVATSRVFETEPVGPEQPQYLNAVVIVETEMSPMDLLELCQRIEFEANRVREERWGPRTLDLDVLDIAGYASEDPVLTVPHPLSHERGFVLVPWADADPNWIHGRAKKAVSSLAASVVPGYSGPDEVLPKSAGIWLRDDLALVLPE